MARGNRMAVRGQREKRLTDWFFLTPVANTFTAAGGTLIGSLNTAALAMRPFTVIRTHYEIQVVSDQAAAIENQAGALGTCVVSDQASDIGITAVPTPITDMGSDLWYQHNVFYGDESNLTDRTRGESRMTVDSKAMRKVDIGQDISGVVELDTVGSTGGAIIRVVGRMLVKVN